MYDKEIEQQINDIIEGEIQNSINEYLEQQQQSKGEDSGLGFASDDGKAHLNVKVSQAEVDRLVKEYKKALKYRKSPLFAVQNMDNNERLVNQMVEELKKGEGGTGITE